MNVVVALCLTWTCSVDCICFASKSATKIESKLLERFRSLNRPVASKEAAGGGINIIPELPEAGAYELRLPFKGPNVEKLRL